MMKGGPVAALNVYKKVAVIRRSNDSLAYEDVDGTVKTVTDLGNAASTATPAISASAAAAAAAAAGSGSSSNNNNNNNNAHNNNNTNINNANTNNNNKAGAGAGNVIIHDIPVPQIRLVESYEKDIPNNYKIQSSFVRYHRPSREEWKESIEYVADAEDESWLTNNAKFGGLLYPPEEEEEEEEIEDMMIVPGGGGAAAATATAATTTGLNDNNKDDDNNINKNNEGSDSKTSSTPLLLSKEEQQAQSQQQKNAETSTTKTTNPVEASTKIAMDVSTTRNAAHSLLPKPKPKQSRLLKKKKQSQLPLSIFEHMMDLLEKATAFDAIVSTSQAEQLIHTKIPQINLLFPSSSSSSSSTSTAITKGGAGATTTTTTTTIANNNNNNKAGGGSSSSGTTLTTKVTTKQVIHDIYQYWVQKRSKLKRPLLRRFWPVTSTDDTNPHLVFRPREKEKYKLRKTRRNDLLSYNKMKQLRSDFENLRLVLDLVKKREELYRAQLQMQCETFQQKLFDITDTSGKPRLSNAIKKRKIDDVLAIPTYFDINISSGKRGKRGRNNNNNNNNNNKALAAAGSSAAAAASGGGSRSVSPVPGAAGAASAAGGAGGLIMKGDGTTMIVGGGGGGVIGGTTATSIAVSDPTNAAAAAAASGNAAAHAAADALPRVVAGQNFGEPAPNFLQPLQTRESYVTSWDDSVPHFTSYIEARAAPTYRFRHRPRVGRGGRVVIDRLPCPSHPETIPMTFFTAGKGLSRHQRQQQQNVPGSSTTTTTNTLQQQQQQDNKTRLLDLLPEPLDRRAVSRRIEELSLAALQEDMEIATGGGGAQGPAGAPLDGEENDGEQVLVKLDDWLDTDEQPWGEERYAIGPV